MELKKDIRRFDNIDNSQWMTVPFERTTEGFLKGRAIVTSIGVFTYKRKDGTDNYMELIQNISRNFTDMKLMRDRVVNKTFCEPYSDASKMVS